MAKSWTLTFWLETAHIRKPERSFGCLHCESITRSQPTNRLVGRGETLCCLSLEESPHVAHSKSKQANNLWKCRQFGAQSVKNRTFTVLIAKNECILFHFSAKRNQLVISYPTYLWTMQVNHRVGKSIPYQIFGSFYQQPLGVLTRNFTDLFNVPFYTCLIGYLFPFCCCSIENHKITHTIS